MSHTTHTTEKFLGEWSAIAVITEHRLINELLAVNLKLERGQALPDDREIGWQIREHELMIDAYSHLLALAIRHIERRVRSTERIRALSYVDSFLDLFDSEDLADLRDGLEHSDEYQIGSGRFPDRLVASPTSFPTAAPDVENGRVVALRLYGQRYSIDEAMRIVYQIAIDLGYSGLINAYEVEDED